MTQPARASADSFEVGMELDEMVYGPMRRQDFVRYAEASGDDNPIHQDERYARSTGAPTVFAMGMLPAGYLAHALGDWFGSPEHIRRYRVRFTTRTWPGDRIACVGRVEAVDGTRIEVSIEALRRGEGPKELSLPVEETALTGEAEIELPE